MRYLATLIGATDEQTMRWFILVVAMLLDPAAVLLLMVAQMTSLPGPDRPDFLDRQGLFSSLFFWHMPPTRYRGPPMRIVDRKEIVELLRIEVEKAEGKSAWAKKTGVHRSVISKALHGAKPPTESIICALGLRIVIVSDR